MIVWGLSGGAARAIGLFEAAKVCMERGEKPDIIIGTSSGSLLAPIIAVAYEIPELMDIAIKFAQTLDPLDMFPYKRNRPFNKKGKPTVNAIFRIIGGHNHLGWQDIKPLYKKVFTETYFKILQKSPIICQSFGVVGEDGSPEILTLNDADNLDEMINMIEKSSRIVPFVQSIEGRIDGGFISFNPSMWVLKDNKVGTLVSIYSHELKQNIDFNKDWNKNILTTTTQSLLITTHWLGVKDALIEELYCKLNNIDYLRIECPNGYTDEIYESDDDQLIAFGKASRLNAQKKWNNTEVV